MIYEKKQLILAFLLTAAAGCGLHSLYSFWPNEVIALLAPVNESLWEHVKIIFWPYLAAALWCNRDRPTGIRPWLGTLLILCGLMLAAGYVYHVTLGMEGLWFDLSLYGVLMVLGFWLPTRFSGPYQGLRWKLPILFTFLLALAVVVFTVAPPKGLLFTDLSKANSWFILPC